MHALCVCARVKYIVRVHAFRLLNYAWLCLVVVDALCALRDMLG